MGLGRLEEESWAYGIALLSQEGSGIAKRIPRGVVPKRRFDGLQLWNHPGALRHPS